MSGGPERAGSGVPGVCKARAVHRLAALALLCATACTASKVAQDADVTVRGTVQGADGAPLAGAKVVLVKEADIGEAVFGLAVLAGTLGTICLVDEPPAICSKARRATTAVDGSYSFRLQGRDTRASSAMRRRSTSRRASPATVRR